MDTVSHLFIKLSNSLNNFREEYKLHYPTDHMSDTWSVKDILCHISYWHRYYAENLSAEAKGKSFIIPKTKLFLMNQEGVEKMRQYSDEKLFRMLAYAHNKLGKAVLSGKVKQMTYWEGRKPYTLIEFLEVVDRHIGAHTRGIKKKRKKYKLK